MDERLSADFVMVQGLETVGELKRQIWPLQPKKNAVPPFLFYIQTDDDEDDTLGDLTGLQHTGYALHAVAADYRSLALVGRKIKAAMNALAGRAWARGDTSVCNAAVCGRAAADIAGDVLLVEDIRIMQVSPDIYETEVGYYRRIYQIEMDYQTERSVSA